MNFAFRGNKHHDEKLASKSLYLQQLRGLRTNRLSDVGTPQELRKGDLGICF